MANRQLEQLDHLIEECRARLQRLETIRATVAEDPTLDSLLIDRWISSDSNGLPDPGRLTAARQPSVMHAEW
jgi:hypothetical protein